LHKKHIGDAHGTRAFCTTILQCNLHIPQQKVSVKAAISSASSANACHCTANLERRKTGTLAARITRVIHILKIISTVGQSVLPLISFELMGFAVFLLAMIQNALIGIDTQNPKN
jgi:hypothetical protein